MLNKKKIRAHISRLVIPTILENLLMKLTAVITTAMIGRLLTTDISSKGIAERMLSLYYMVFIGFGIGATVLIATSYGRGNLSRCRRIAEQTMLMILPLSLLLVPLTIFFTTQIASFFTSDALIIQTSAKYLRIAILVVPFFAISRIVTAAFHGMGDTRTPMVLGIAHNILGVVVGYVAIFGIGGVGGWGLIGAAISSVTSQATITFAGLLLLYRSDGAFRLNPHRQKLISFNNDLFKGILSIGLPASAENVCSSLAFILMSKALLSYGSYTFAAYQLGVQAEMLAEVLAAGFTTVTTSLGAMAVGQQNNALFKAYFFEMRKLALLVGAGATLLLFTFPIPLMRLFTDNTTLHQIGAGYVRIMAIAQIPQILSFIYIGAARAAGYKRLTLLSTMIGIWLVRVPFSFLTAWVFHGPIEIIWFAIVADQLCRIAISVFVFNKKKVINTAVAL